MSDIINLLPDSIANQIAAGEVIQRPASVVKELLENSVDAGATSIHLIVKDSGKTLLQVVDNGKGMSETDARMSLERHATSKINKAEDLFNLRTMGFRGEALASIAAVAQLEMKTRTEQRDIGTHLIAEGSVVKSQELCAHEVGTTLSVKNLFFNVPARRKFLKSDNVEMRHIIDEFERVALINPEIEFKLHHNDQQLFFLPVANRRQRIVNVLGKGYNEKLVPIEEETEIVKLSGFIGKPESARKSRGEQFLFVNGRYFKSSYFHSAIQQAFEGLIPLRHHPTYFIYFDIAPESIDVNIHPTKTEIKFEDERSVYAILRSTVKRSIGQYHVSPSLDFEKETSFDILPPKEGTEIPKPGVMIDTSFNPFSSESKQEKKQHWERGSAFSKPSTENWEAIYDGMNEALNTETEPQDASLALEQPTNEENTIVRQIGLRYILVQSDEGTFILHQYRAHTRILFEEFEQSIKTGIRSPQQLLFPATIELSTQDTALLTPVLSTVNALGFQIEPFGNNAFIVQAVPSGCTEVNPELAIAGLIDDLRENKPQDNQQAFENILKSLAQQSAIKSGQELKAQEMINLFQSLMRCYNPQIDLKGRETFKLLNDAAIEKIFD